MCWGKAVIFKLFQAWKIWLIIQCPSTVSAPPCNLMQWNIVLPLTVMEWIHQIKTLVEVKHIKHKERAALVEACWEQGGDETSPVPHPRDALRVFLPNPKVGGVKV